MGKIAIVMIMLSLAVIMASDANAGTCRGKSKASKTCYKVVKVPCKKGIRTKSGKRKAVSSKSNTNKSYEKIVKDSIPANVVKEPVYISNNITSHQVTPNEQPLQYMPLGVNLATGGGSWGGSGMGGGGMGGSGSFSPGEDRDDYKPSKPVYSPINYNTINSVFSEREIKEHVTVNNWVYGSVHGDKDRWDKPRCDVKPSEPTETPIPGALLLFAPLAAYLGFKRKGVR